MAIGDVPTFASAAHAHTTYGLGAGGGFINTNTTAGTGSLLAMQGISDDVEDAFRGYKQTGITRDQVARARAQVISNIQPQPKEEPMSGRRLVQVIVVDPNDNVPLENCILYKGDEKLTDLNDQELFFELDIKALLTAHNEKRITFIDKKVKERTEHLEPAKVRDLKMVVITVAGF